MYLFKVLVSIAFNRTEDMTNDIWLSHKATWYESFGETKRVYEGTFDRYNLYLGLLINTETEDPVICDPLWLSEMLEAGFISKLILTAGRAVQTRPKPDNPAKPPDDNPIPARTEGPVGRRRVSVLKNRHRRVE